jgi:hypothetical protein
MSPPRHKKGRVDDPLLSSTRRGNVVSATLLRSRYDIYVLHYPLG